MRPKGVGAEMLTKITCPECEAVLRPAKPVAPGKAIKCPKCGAGFVAAEEEAPPRAKPRAAAAPAKKGAAKPAAKNTSDKVAKKPGKEEKAAPAPKKKKDPFDDDDDGGLTYGVTQEPEAEEEDEKKREISYAPDTSIKDLRGPAQAAVVQPTNMLTITGVLGFVGWLGLLVIILIPILFPLAVESGSKENPTPVLSIEKGFGMQAAQPPQGGERAAGGEKEEPSMFIVLGFDLAIFALYPWYMLLLVLLPIFVGMAYSGVIIAGAVKAQNLESRGWGIAASIMAMLPFNAGGLIIDILLVFNVLLHMLLDDQDLVNYVSMIIAGAFCLGEIGVGVWCLTVLMREEVKAGFEFRPD
jgi:hypothetical protein